MGILADDPRQDKIKPEQVERLRALSSDAKFVWVVAELSTHVDNALDQLKGIWPRVENLESRTDILAADSRWHKWALRLLIPGILGISGVVGYLIIHLLTKG